MKNSFVYVTLFGIILGGMSNTVARAGIMVFTPNRDNSMFAENNNSNGTGGLFVGVTAGNQGTSIRRALVQFDIASSIPAGSTINSVTLRVERVIGGPNSGADVLSIHPVTAAWGEGTSFGVGKGAAPTANDATWNFRFFNTSSWTNPGGDFGASSGTVTLDNVNNQFTFASQAGMVANVQNWANNPSSNFGWLLKYVDEVSVSTARYFASRENMVTQRPTLTVDFTVVPEPSSCLLLSAAALITSTYRSRRQRT